MHIAVFTINWFISVLCSEILNYNCSVVTFHEYHAAIAIVEGYMYIVSHPPPARMSLSVFHNVCVPISVTIVAIRTYIIIFKYNIHP